MEGLDDLRKQRLEKLNGIQDLEIQPYAYDFDRTHFASDCETLYDPDNEGEKKVKLAGRLMAIRRMGKASFGHLMDTSGRIQIYVKLDAVGETPYQLFKLMDIGDILSHDPNGALCTYNGYAALCAEYTDEVEFGGHLNARGQLRMAKAYWVLMAKLAGWSGVP